MLEGYKCERCSHEWVPRSKTDDTPIICPRCKSPYWDRPKKKGKNNEQAAAVPMLSPPDAEKKTKSETEIKETNQN